MSQRDRTRRPATYEDLLRVPDHLVAEIVDGELFATPRPSPRHASATSALIGSLHGPFDGGRGGPGGWRILFEPELHLGPDVLVPDIAGGAASDSRRFLMRRSSRWRPTGCARCSRHQLQRSIG